VDFVRELLLPESGLIQVQTQFDVISLMYFPMHPLRFLTLARCQGFQPGACTANLHSTVYGTVVVLLTLIILSGCSSEKIDYRLNLLHAASLSPEAEQSELESLALVAKRTTESLLGTIDAPQWPTQIEPPFDMRQVKLCAGPVGRDKKRIESGLFRKHCVQCHGLTGDGVGPAAALLAPYPRDFRRGTFKFKSTPIGKKPTHADLVRTLEKGLPGTSMPAFGKLNESKEFANDVEALANYVRFLSIRGDLERRLLNAFEGNERGDDDQLQIVAIEILRRLANEWQSADSFAVPAPEWQPITDSDLQASELRGKDLFASELTACVKCHGLNGDGQGASQDFDDWTKDWTIRAGIDPAKKSEWKIMKKYGALKPVLDRSRNLTLGAFKGGSDRDDIYKRLVGGIEGSPMPAVARITNDNPGLTEQNIQDLVNYVLSLSKAPNLTAPNLKALEPNGVNRASSN
jgi:mono/diheme cytochrome c family protein